MNVKYSRLICLILTVVIMLSAVLMTSCSSESTETEQVKTSETETEENQDPVMPDSATVCQAEKKDEVVTATADQTGSVYGITSKCTLSGFSSESGDFVEDISELEDIENKRGSEKYISKNSHVYWENYGSSITYEGTGTKELPVSVSITYFLNGKKTEPQQLAGQKGHVKIRFDYTNHTGGDDYIPFSAMTLLIFDSNTFSNVKISNGTVMNMGSSIFAIGYTIPDFKKNFGDENYENAGLDLPDYIEFEADTDFFELDFTTTSVSNGLTEQIAEQDTYSEDSVIASMDALLSASSALTTGAGEILNVLTQYGTYLDTFTESVEKIINMLTEAGSKLKNVPYYIDLIKKYSKKVMSVDEIMQLVSDLRAEFSPEKTSRIYEALDLAISEIREKYPEEAEVLTDLKTTIQKIQEDVEGVTDEDVSAFREYLEAEDSLYTQISDYLNDISGGVINLETGADAYSEQIEELKQGYRLIISAVKEYSESIKKFDREGIKKLGQKSDELKALAERINVLKEADSAYNTYSGHAANTESSVTYIIQTDGIY